MHQKVIKFEVQAPIAIEHNQALGFWVIDCPSLKIAIQEGTKERALEVFPDVVMMWLDSCIERNTLVQAIEELGFVRGSPSQGESSEQSAFIKITFENKPIRASMLHAPTFDMEREVPRWAAHFPLTAASVVNPGTYRAQL